MTAALFAARRGMEVTLIDGNPGVGRKLLVTGAGRANLSNQNLAKMNLAGADLRDADLRHANLDLANLENSRFIYQTGQSGNAFSARYSDMARQWRVGISRAFGQTGARRLAG